MIFSKTAPSSDGSRRYIVFGFFAFCGLTAPVVFSACVSSAVAAEVRFESGIITSATSFGAAFSVSETEPVTAIALPCAKSALCFSSILGKTITSISPNLSSTLTNAIGAPALVCLFTFSVTVPATVTLSPSRNLFSSVSSSAPKVISPIGTAPSFSAIAEYSSEG